MWFWNERYLLFSYDNWWTDLNKLNTNAEPEEIEEYLDWLIEKGEIKSWNIWEEDDLSDYDINEEQAI